MPGFIEASFPHMVLNSHDVPPPDYEMYNSWKVAASDSVDHMIDWIAEVARGTEIHKLKTLIFNSHGAPGNILIGSGIALHDANKFYKLNGLVDEIWIVACRVAGSNRDVASGATAGQPFCRDMALASGAYVTAGTKKQYSGLVSIPPGHIDEWEGTVYTFTPKGERALRQLG